MSERWLVGTAAVDVDVEAVRGLDAHPTGDGRVRLADGREAVVAGDQVCLGGRTRRVVRAPPRAAAPPPVVTPPMPGVVGRVLVAVGDEVEAGQGLVTVTAMKMELTLRAPHAGRVAEIRVGPGDNVQPGQVLVEVRR